MIIGIGAIVAYGGTTPPAGSLLCDGSAISRTSFSGLFAVIGTRYGAGDGSTTFNLPNLPSGSVTYVISYADDTTGNGAIVLAHAATLGSPTLVNPTLGTASATSLAFSSATGLVGAVGTDAPAGSVGEYIVSRVDIPGVSLSSNVLANVTSIALTPGDWEVRGQVAFVTATTTQLGEIQAYISGASTDRPGGANDEFPISALTYQHFVPGNETQILPTTMGRINIISPLTVYLGANAIFSVSTVQAYGFIAARRMR
ncbi:MAG TPA: phage tail protein [Rhizomicrobium sp.]|jgi:microcystin-dependent protein|nr:phage tail protein [Rhizomicrobium sp.]